MGDAALQAQRIFDEAADLPFPPADLEDYDQICQAIFGDVENLYLPFSERGRNTWPSFEQRIEVSRMYVSTFQDDLRRLAFEREKIH